MPPQGIDFVDVEEFPLDELVAVRLEARLLAPFANGGFAQALPGILASRDRLPEAGAVRTLQEQHLQRRRVDHDQRRDRDLVTAQTRARAVTEPSPVKNACGMSRVRWRATVV